MGQVGRRQDPDRPRRVGPSTSPSAPPGWSDTEGLSDTTIKIGQSLVAVGHLRRLRQPRQRRIDFIFGYYNDQGFFKDTPGKTRKVDYIMKDDGYDAARAIPNVDELLDSEKVFAIWTLGTPATLKTYDKINQRCVPQPLAMTAHSAWGDPVNHPWTTGAPNPTYSTEAILWGAFIEQRLNEFPTDRRSRSPRWCRTTTSASSTTRRSSSTSPQSPTLQGPRRLHHRDDRGVRADRHRPDDHAGRGEPRRLHLDAGRHPVHPDLILEAAQNGMKEQAKYLFIAAGRGPARPSSARTSSVVTARPATAGGCSAPGSRTSRTRPSRTIPTSSGSSTS